MYLHIYVLLNEVIEGKMMERVYFTVKRPSALQTSFMTRGGQNREEEKQHTP